LNCLLYTSFLSLSLFLRVQHNVTLLLSTRTDTRQRGWVRVGGEKEIFGLEVLDVLGTGWVMTSESVDYREKWISFSQKVFQYSIVVILFLWGSNWVMGKNFNLHWIIFLVHWRLNLITLISSLRFIPKSSVNSA
jgi:hypothetical protein